VTEKKRSTGDAVNPNGITDPGCELGALVGYQESVGGC